MCLMTIKEPVEMVLISARSPLLSRRGGVGFLIGLETRRFQTSFFSALASIVKQRADVSDQISTAWPRHRARRRPENPTDGCERHAAEDKGALYVN